MAKAQATSTQRIKPNISRPGVHSKSKNSVHKTGKHYNKPYKGQGR